MAWFYGKPVSPASSQEAFVVSLRQPFGAGPVLASCPPSRTRPPFSKKPRDPTSSVPAVCREHPERDPISVPLAKRAGLHRGALYGLSAVKRHRRQRRVMLAALSFGLARKTGRASRVRVFGVCTADGYCSLRQLYRLRLICRGSVLAVLIGPLGAFAGRRVVLRHGMHNSAASWRCQ